jgi:flagellar protein FlaG
MSSVEALRGSAVQSLDMAARAAAQPSSGSVEAVTPPPASFEANEKVLISGDDLKAAIDHLNSHMQKMNRNVNFSVDGASGKDVVRVTDSNTGETVRQLPSEDMLTFIRNLDNMVGVIFDSRT